MLTHMHIRHFAIIDDTAIEFDEGLTALTGETGAGKSILIDALGLLLGDRASIDAIQQGADRAEITASFAISDATAVIQWLADHDLDSDGDCLLRRVVASNGKSRASINGRPVAVQMLREIGALLVRIHGQHDHQRVSRNDEQRQLLDRYANSRHADTVARHFRQWREAGQALTTHRANARTRQERLDLVEFQLQEFDGLDIGGAAVADIEAEHRWLANVEQRVSLGNEAMARLSDEDGAADALTAAGKPLETLVDIDERLREALDLVESAAIQTAEAGSLLRHYLSGVEHDDQRLQWLDNRLAALHRLARKHQVDMDQLGVVEGRLREEFEQLTGPEADITALEQAHDAAAAAFTQSAGKLSSDRQRAARALSKAVTRSIQTLGMNQGKFVVDISADPEHPSQHGIDSIQFLVQPNPGVDAAPLSRIASGGELSRISLCLQLATLDVHHVPTLLFDEVDTGVGGAVAETVGKLLRQVGERVQVMCVTHLPQVAAQGHHHLRVEKHVLDGQTRTRVQALDPKATREEIARMLGGAKVTRKSRQHAQEMLDTAGAD